MRKLRNGKKGLSPIFAVLILIAIAVVAGIVIYMYTSGYLATMMGGGGAGQEKVTILSVDTATAGHINVYAKSVGGGDVMISDAVVRDSAGKVVALGTVKLAAAVKLPSAGTTTQVDVPFGFTSGNYYTITLVSELGNAFVSTSFKA